MIEKRQFLYFFPPTLNGNDIPDKRRYMLIISEDNNIIKMLNVSSIKNRTVNLWYDSNIEIANYFPLPQPSFVKLDKIYEIKYFEGLENYIAKDGLKLTYKEFSKILLEYEKYKEKHNIEKIEYKEKQFKESNKLIAK